MVGTRRSGKSPEQLRGPIRYNNTFIVLTSWQHLCSVHARPCSSPAMLCVFRDTLHLCYMLIIGVLYGCLLRCGRRHYPDVCPQARFEPRAGLPSTSRPPPSSSRARHARRPPRGASHPGAAGERARTPSRSASCQLNTHARSLRIRCTARQGRRRQHAPARAAHGAPSARPGPSRAPERGS